MAQGGGGGEHLTLQDGRGANEMMYVKEALKIVKLHTHETWDYSDNTCPENQGKINKFSLLFEVLFTLESISKESICPSVFY